MNSSHPLHQIVHFTTPPQRAQPNPAVAIWRFQRLHLLLLSLPLLASNSYRIFSFPHIAVILAVSTPFSAHLSCRPSCILEGSSSILDSQTIQHISPIWSHCNHCDTSPAQSIPSQSLHFSRRPPTSQGKGTRFSMSVPDIMLGYYPCTIRSRSTGSPSNTTLPPPAWVQGQPFLRR